MTGIRILAIVVAAVVYFFIGAIWYGQFSVAWLAGIGKTVEQIEREHGGSMLPFVVGFVAVLVMCYTLNWIIGRALEPPTSGSGAMSGAVVALGLIGATLALNYGFEARSVSLWLINAVYVLVGLAMAGAIIGGWKKKHAQ